MKTQKTFLSMYVGLAVLICGVTLWAEPMSTAFTYQGRLLNDNIAANGLYDFEFTLHYSDPNDLLVGVQVTLPVDDVQVTDGYFVTELDYGSDPLNGEKRWLEIAVRPGASTDPGDFVTLNPAIELTATPYALQTRGLFVDEETLNVGIATTSPTEELEVAGTVKADTFVGDGSGLTGISYSETDPQVGTNTNNYVPKWDGSALVNGTIYDNGNEVAIGTTSLADRKFYVLTDSDTYAVYGRTQNTGGSQFAVRGYAAGNTPGFSYGVTGSSHSETGDNFGVRGVATTTSTGTNIGVSGIAFGGVHNWAGYFEGNGYFSDYVGIGIETPTEKLDVVGTVKATAFVGDGSGLTGISFSETDPQVGSNTTNYVPKWNGSALSTGTIYDNGNIGIATANPAIDLAIGDTDTGLQQQGDGQLALYTNNVERVRVDSGGRVGIGKIPSYALDISGNRIQVADSTGDWIAMRTDGASADMLDFSYGGGSLAVQGSSTTEHILLNPASGASVGVGTWVPSRKFFVNGEAGGTTAWYNDSDARLKKEVVTIDNALEKVGKLRGVQYEWKNSADHAEGKQIGFIGQETADVVPEVVDIKDGLYSMQYASLTALLVEAVKEQQKQIETMTAEIDRLKEQIKNQ